MTDLDDIPALEVVENNVRTTTNKTASVTITTIEMVPFPSLHRATINTRLDSKGQNYENET